MAKVSKATDGATPKKRGKAAVAEPTNGVGATTTQVAELVATAKPTPVAAAHAAVVSEQSKVVPVEEKIRVRAYELYLQRRGQHGSPEQDWFQAVQEICGRQIA